MRAAICDDQPQALEELKKMLCGFRRLRRYILILI